MKTNDIIAAAKRHSIRRDVPSPDFFEGAVMGNGGLGVVVCTRPDAVVLHLGHNSIWDIRIEEGHKEYTRTFGEIWGRILREKDSFSDREWFRDYCDKMRASYRFPYPRPFPASSVYLFFDRKGYEILGHELDISDGLLKVEFEDTEKKKYHLYTAVSMEKDQVYCRTEDESGNPCAIFYRMLIVPNPPENGLPEAQILDGGFRQILPANGYEGAVRPGVDKGFSLLYRLNGKREGKGLDTRVSETSEIAFQVTQGYFDEVEKTREAETEPFEEVLSRGREIWGDYWRRSGIKLGDGFLEHIWYTNTYFSRCVLSAKSRCPGLFGNWMAQNIGTAWHGDYHMNYNTQQPFWGLMSSNRQDLHLTYISMIESLMPVSKAWAKDFYGLDGAYIPHTVYPVPMTVNPYPVPDWGWEIFETPWAVQSLWWHYTYTKDIQLLKDRVYPLIRAAAAFLAGYMTREDSDPLKDGKYHLYPTIVPELYGLANGLKMNLDVAVDLTFTKFIFKALLQGVKDLGLEEEEAELTGTVGKILASYPDYPTADGRFGKVYVSVRNEDPDRVIYNTPANLMQIFPGEDTDAQSADEEAYAVACNSWRHHYNEGGNDLVFYYLIGARLGIIDLEQFKRHVRYCLLPNGTATDRATLTGGRYGDTMDLGFMARMGIWVENLSLYSVINECLLWGHTDTIVVFPNWDLDKPAEFCSLRTKGAFLIDSACSDGEVKYISVRGERGGTARIRNPWKKAEDDKGNVYDGEVIAVPLQIGESVRLKGCG